MSFTGDLAVAYRANLWLRSAIRVLQLLREGLLDGRRPAAEAVYDAFRSAGRWEALLAPGQTFGVEGRVWSCSNLSSSQVGGQGLVGLGGVSRQNNRPLTWHCCRLCRLPRPPR